MTPASVARLGHDCSTQNQQAPGVGREFPTIGILNEVSGGNPSCLWTAAETSLLYSLTLGRPEKFGQGRAFHLCLPVSQEPVFILLVCAQAEGSQTAE